MKKITISLLSVSIFIISVLGCTREQKKETYIREIPPQAEALTRFFDTCKSDITKAVDVISEHKMIAILTHLKKMNMEGKKYYLLERENLTEMIRSVTNGTYSDLILINNAGTIIYTMLNDEIFGKNVKTQLSNSALNSCFSKSFEKSFHIEDISDSPPDDGIYKLFVAMPDRSEDYVRGVFIIQINFSIIEPLLDNNTVITGYDGICRMDKNTGNMLKPYLFFDKIKTDGLDKKEKEQFIAGNKTYTYYPFRYNDISWIVISGE